VSDILVIRTHGYMQSWGVGDTKNYRLTQPYPTKSGIIGLCCCALGINPKKHVARYSTFLKEFKKVEFMVRCDKSGSILRDYQNSSGFMTLNGNWTPAYKDKNIQSYRYYIFGGDFSIALKGNEEFLKIIYNALRNPRWNLFLGRNCCLPASQLADKYFENVEQELIDFMKQYNMERCKSKMIVREVPLNEIGIKIYDEPIGLNWDGNLQYSFRNIRIETF